MNSLDEEPKLSLVPEGKSAGVNEGTLGEQAYNRLRKDIICGVFEPGQALRLEALRERYGISFSPIREALTRLQAEKLVFLAPSKGFRVLAISISEMWDAINTRILIDCEALRKSIERKEATWEGRLTQAYAALCLAQQRPSPDELDMAQHAELLEQRHKDFHYSMISSCGSDWLLTYSTQLYAQTERYRRPSLASMKDEHVRGVDKEHLALLEASLARETDLACALLAKHYRDTGFAIQRVLERKQQGLV
jgi:DNA-binding GntR family transcriptional regulator